MPEVFQITEVDLVNPQTFFVNRLPDMSVVQERLFRHFRNRIFQEFRRNVQSAADKYEIIKHDEYLAPRGGYNLYGVFNIHPIKGFALVTIEGELLAALVDDLFGAEGPSLNEKLAPTEISAMETRIGRRLMEIMADATAVALQQYFAVNATIIRTEGFAALASVGDATEPYCVLASELTLPTGSGGISIALPYRGLEPFSEILASPLGGQAHQDASSIWAMRAEMVAEGIPVEVAFEIGTVAVTTNQLATLAAGDTLPLTFHRKARAMAGEAVLAEVTYGSIESYYGVTLTS